ncbi:conserved hypothetical protein [Roseovarius sp. EC-HK134]|uniref:hypothetical protein n=1 Tax=unclassified Roseovarius TaxID=2614913 RepID=UPI00125531CD|nr:MULTISPECIES: hypothetical protein [unclassified Roseovarius]VVT27396.1 conserved hypothetical protein [Roseovarius sp. EC-SD190]VVT27880.1 conserved hypothetical protein [Roseovarius sp. EC-HK134]
MIDTEEFNTKTTRLQQAITDRMRLRGPTLERQLRRAGRRLPRRQRRAGAIVLGAQDWMAHAKLARVLDMGQVDRAFSDLHAYLDTLDPQEARKTAVLRLVGGIVLNLMLLAGLIYALIRWQSPL